MPRRARPPRRRHGARPGEGGDRRPAATRLPCRALRGCRRHRPRPPRGPSRPPAPPAPRSSRPRRSLRRGPHSPRSCSRACTGRTPALRRRRQRRSYGQRRDGEERRRCDSPQPQLNPLPPKRNGTTLRGLRHVAHRFRVADSRAGPGRGAEACQDQIGNRVSCGPASAPPAAGPISAPTPQQAFMRPKARPCARPAASAPCEISAMPGV